MASCAGRGAQALPDSLRLPQQLPVVAPRALSHRRSDGGLEMLAGCPCRVLLRIAPAVPRAFDRAIDELEPLRIGCAVGWKWQRQHLPDAVVRDSSHHRLAARPPPMPVGIGKIRVGGHETLLDRAYAVGGGVKRGGGARRGAPAPRQLESIDRFGLGGRWLRLAL